MTANVPDMLRLVIEIYSSRAKGAKPISVEKAVLFTDKMIRYSIDYVADPVATIDRIKEIVKED